MSLLPRNQYAGTNTWNRIASLSRDTGHVSRCTGVHDHNNMSKEILTTDFAADSSLLLLERQVLVQYQSLAVKLNTLSDEIAKLNKPPPSQADASSGSADALLGNMRNLERKIGLVYTLFRTAVYSLLLQNQENREREEREEEERGLERGVDDSELSD